MYDVIILGGGCAGLKAAETLYSNGVTNILLLEAQERLGGRIETILIDNNVKLPLEMGANWLHGTTGNPLYEIVQEHKEIFKNQRDKAYSENNTICLDHDGNLIDSTLDSQVSQYYWDQMEKIRVDDIKFDGESLENYLLEKLNGDDLKKIIMRKTMSLHCINAGCQSIDECSMDHYKSYVEFDGGDSEFPGGYSKLIDFLASKIPSGTIKLNNPIENVERDGNNLIVKCKNGDVFNTKHLLVTCSLGYLQKHYATLFSHNLLPSSKIDALTKLKLGAVNKIYFEYSDMSFFPESIDSVYVVPTENTSNKWMYRVCKIGKFYDNLLRVLLTGDDAKQIENLTDEEISLDFTNYFRRILKNENVPLPSRLIRTYWCGNPYILGSYVYIARGATVDHINELAKPVYFDDNIPKISFAGEGIHPKYYSTVLAAYLTGECQANEFIKYIKN